MCIGLTWQGFGSRGLPPGQTELVSAGSKTDLPMAKAEPITDVGGVSVLTYLRRCKNHCAIAASREE